MSACTQETCSCQTADPGVTAAGGVSGGYRPWLHRLAIAVVVVTFVVLVSGGNVTSRDAGLAVPDGYTVFGHVLWLFPYSQWVGNIFHEHVHRLNGSLIGVLAIVLAVSLVVTQKHRRWVRLAGLVMLLMVLVQGVLGAMRVNQISTTLAVVHAVHGQMVFCVTVLLAAATSRYAHRFEQMHLEKPQRTTPIGRVLGGLSVAVWGTLLVQLILGAVVRHTGSGLAIPDFPSAYGGFIPPLTETGIENAINKMPYEEVVTTGYFSVAQVAVHWVHRLWALVVAGGVICLVTKVHKVAANNSMLTRPVTGLVVLLIGQVALGAAVVLTSRIPDVATAHQAVGAVMLGLATLLVVRLHLFNPFNSPTGSASASDSITAVSLDTGFPALSWAASQPT